MSLYFKKTIKLLFLGILLLGFGFFWQSLMRPVTANTNLNGRILLQVEDKGQAWYVNPLDSQRYYLGRPDDAFQIMRSLGLGVSNSDITAFQTKAPLRLSGRILLQVQDKGQAYYVSPLDLKLYYLGRPADAFNLMREKGLGITNSDLSKIVIFAPVDTAVSPGHFSLKYQNNSYEITQDLSPIWYQTYQNLSKVYSYSAALSATGAREAFYGMFLDVQPGDNTLDNLVIKLKTVALNNNWTEDQLAEFAMALVQYIPYDHAKLAQDNDRNNNPYYPYETLYLNRGVCSDKTFLAVDLLRALGYGAAILDFPEENHSAAGIACPVADSLNGSGYCYVETTNYFPLGALPQSISAGQADMVNGDFTSLFNTSSLGRVEMYQLSVGKIYQGISANRQQAQNLQDLKATLSAQETEVNSSEINMKQEESNLKTLKDQLDSYYNSGQITQYNNLVPSYNMAVNQYNANLVIYKEKIASYNVLVAEFNQVLTMFYQK